MFAIPEISLEPKTSDCDITIEILVDGQKTHKLGRVTKGQPTRWSKLSLPCDVRETSTVTVRVIEIRTIRDRAESHMCRMSQVAERDTWSIGRDGGRYTVNLVFLSEEAAELAYREALAKVRQIESRPNVMDRFGRTGLAFKTLLELGRTMADLDPNGDSKPMFATWVRAWEHLRKQNQQNKDLNKLVEDLAGIIPSLELVKRLANVNLGDTVTGMLNLVEDAALFILGLDSRSSRAVQTRFINPVKSAAQTFTTRLKSLRKDFDIGVGVQTENVIRSRLKPLDLAGYDPTQACMPGTRAKIIHDITTWAQDSNRQQHLAWVHGSAGFGKTSIAASVCQHLNKQGILAASFFCKRDNPELLDPRRILATIAYGLALRWKPYGRALVLVVHADPGVCSQQIQPLCDALLSKPLQEAAKSELPDRPLTIFVDALDECGTIDTRRQLITCLYNVSRTVPWFRVVMTSRPDPDIQECFTQLGVHSFTLYNLLDYDALADIRRFIQAELRNMEQTVESWPKDAVDGLSERSGGLFQWAQATCKFIADGYDPRKRLEQVLADKSPVNASAQLDALYATTIRASVMNNNSNDLSVVLRCLGILVATSSRTSLSILNLSKLLRGRVPLYTIGRVLHSLSSLLHLDHEHGNVVRIIHPSFTGYIIDRTRSGELCVNLGEQNALLAECCLETMMAELRFNICELWTSGRRNRDVPNLDMRVRGAFSPQLRYSCLYWASHVARSQGGTTDGPLRAFLFGRELLYWIKALSLLRKLSVALSSLLELSRAPNIAKDCQAYVYDVYRFVLWSYDAISESTPHLYVSALALAPGKSQAVQHMRSHFPNLLVLNQGEEQDWTPCLRTIWAVDVVKATATSPDGRRIATGSDDKMVRVWDAKTGSALLEPLRGHSERVWSVAFSPDSLRIVSGSEDKTLRVWDAETGAALLTMSQFRSGGARFVAFSPNGHRIVSGSAGGLVWIWDADTGAALLELPQGHSGPVHSVTFSLDGHRIVSGSGDGTVRVWDSETGAPLLKPLRGHSGSVNSVVFSPNGGRIASGSDDGTIQIWDATTGASLLRLCGHSGSVQSVTFSPDGRFIFSGSKDNTVRIWNAETGAALVKPLRGHSDTVYAVAPSPDGRHIVSGSRDKTIRIWDAKSRDEESEQSQGHTDAVQSVAFSPDGHQVVSGSDDKTVRLWDAETGSALLEPLRGHSGRVYSVVFSPGGHRVISGSADKTIRIWDAETGAALLEPLRGHSDEVNSVALSARHNRIISGSSDNTIRLWDAKTGAALLKPLKGHSGGVWSVAFSRDGHIVSGSGDETIRIWDARSGRALLQPLRSDSGYIYSVAFSPDGRRILSSFKDSTVRVWDANTGAALLQLLPSHSGRVWSASFSSDGRRIVSGSGDKTVRVWDAKTGTALLEPLLGHSPSGDVSLTGVYAVAFSPDGRRVVSGSSDNTIRIWDADMCGEAKSLAPRLLQGTQIPVISGCSYSQFVSTSSLLARCSNPDGWVTGLGGNLFLWLPPELRQVDDSSICISTTPLRRRAVMDFTKFVHGTSWSSIARI